VITAKSIVVHFKAVHFEVSCQSAKHSWSIDLSDNRLFLKDDVIMYDNGLIKRGKISRWPVMLIFYLYGRYLSVLKAS